MWSLAFATSFLLLLCFAVHGQPGFLPSAVSDFIDRQEAVVQSIASAATELHARRVNLVRTCECSKHTCSSNLPTPTMSCGYTLGTPSFCESEGRLMDNTSSVISTPSGVKAEDLGTNVMESICIYKHLDEVFTSFGHKETGWMYLGTRDGHTRFYPAVGTEHGQDPKGPFNDCNPFDPRTRPWYISAATGPKDIVLVVDKSLSMNNPYEEGSRTKWELTIEAVEAILDTFTFTDFVNVVTFSDAAAPLWTESGLVRGRRSSLATMKERLRTEAPQGGTNFTAAFSTAFRLLTENCNAEPKSCSNCQKVILFLTDGRDTSREDGESILPSEMLTLVDDLQEQLHERSQTRATIFTYSISDSADDAIPRQIACASNGSWSFLELGSNALDALNSYSLYLAAGRRSTSPIWIEPYEDFNELGMVTTVALSVYASGTRNIPDVFLGVAGHDVILNELERLGFNHEHVLDDIIDRSERCTASRLSGCDLQVFRNAHDARSLCPDRYPVTRTISRRRSRTRSVLLCYKFRESFYKRFTQSHSWNNAVAACEEDGGQLASIVDESELAFVANLASSDGSWIGAQGEARTTFSWLDTDVQNLTNDSGYWGIGEPSVAPSPEPCVAIDSRGIIGNLHTRSCRDALSFICKYESADSCSTEPEELPEEGYFGVPPLGSCIGVEILDETLPVADAENLTSSQVVCDIGEPLSNEEVICCDSSGKGRDIRFWHAMQRLGALGNVVLGVFFSLLVQFL